MLQVFPEVRENTTVLEPNPLGLTTLIFTVPALAIRKAGTEAVNWVVPWKVVDNWELFHWTEEPDTKFDPKTVNVKPGPPIVVEVGLTEEMVGVPDVCWLITKLRVLERAPLGF
jgi:hypothetical protein